MEVVVNQFERQFSAIAHFAIFEDYPQSNSQTTKLIALSYVGRSTPVSAVSASIISGYTIELQNKNEKIRMYMSTLTSKNKDGVCKRFEKKMNNLYHGVVLSKECDFYSEDDSNVILAPDGDIKGAAGKFLKTKFQLPDIWEQQYMDILPDQYIKKLQVKVNPQFSKWKNLKAVRLTGVTEEVVIGLIDKNLKSKLLQIPFNPQAPQGVYEKGMNMAEFLKANAVALAKKVEHLRPWFVPGKDKLHPAIAKEKRIPFPAQAYVIQALVNAFKGDFHTLNVNGEMGVGKSIIASILSRTMQQVDGKKGYSVLLCAPSLTLPKWAEQEIIETLNDTKTHIIRSTEDAGRFLRELRNGYKPQSLEFTLISLDRAKLTSDPWCAAIWRRVHPALEDGQQEKARLSGDYAWHCPDCMRPLLDPKADPETQSDFYATWEVLAESQYSVIKKGQLKTLNGLPKEYLVKWRKRSKLKKCQHCGSRIWRPGLKKRGESRKKPRWFASRILKKLGEIGKSFDLGIFDEVHQAKAEGSGRGDAYAQMVKACKKRLNLSGTITNGKASSVQMILWRTDPKELINDGFSYKTGSIEFASRYGALQKIEFVEDGDQGINTRQIRTQRQPVEIPGISPKLSVAHLFDRTIYIGLGDLGLPLVELEEKPIFIKMDKEHEEAYLPFHNTLYEKAKEVARKGSMSGLAQFTPATVNYADYPNEGACVEIVDGYDGFGNPNIITIKAPALGKDYYNAKERALVKYVREELDQNRGCVIYANYTSKYKIDQRIKKVLADHGIESALLKADTPTDKRVEWLAKRAQEGCKVIICNMSLVEVGLDLLNWPSCFFMQLNFEVNKIRQAGRRNWRIGQYHKCKTFYFVMDGTQQVEVLKRVMKGRGHALLQEGKIDRSELAEYARDEHSALTFDIANCLAGEDLADQWQKLAQKDIDENLEILSEAEFQNVIKQRMADLALQTKTLCGVKDESVDAQFEMVDQTQKQEQEDLNLFTMVDKQQKEQSPEAMSMTEQKQTKVISLLDFWQYPDESNQTKKVLVPKRYQNRRRKRKKQAKKPVPLSPSLFSNEYLASLEGES